MKIQIFLKVSPKDPILIENLESVVIDSDVRKVEDTLKTLPIIIDRNKTYNFIGKKKSVIVEGSDIFYLMTEKD